MNKRNRDTLMWLYSHLIDREMIVSPKLKRDYLRSRVLIGRILHDTSKHRVRSPQVLNASSLHRSAQKRLKPTPARRRN